MISCATGQHDISVAYLAKDRSQYAVRRFSGAIPSASCRKSLAANFRFQGCCLRQGIRVRAQVEDRMRTLVKRSRQNQRRSFLRSCWRLEPKRTPLQEPERTPLIWPGHWRSKAGRPALSSTASAGDEQAAHPFGGEAARQHNRLAVTGLQLQPALALRLCCLTSSVFASVAIPALP
jgi:hypothetical protein